jgi:hypothetical protein
MIYAESKRDFSTYKFIFDFCIKGNLCNSAFLNWGVLILRYFTRENMIEDIGCNSIYV